MPIFLIRRAVVAMVVAMSLIGANPALAADNDDAGTPSAAAMAFDAVIVRPASLVATVAGTGLFIVSLPFSLLGHNTDKAGERLVAEPAKYTFTRPLGDFDAQTPGDD
ncbi:hypothetical protein [Salinisphaera hydrothermalis]|uniref:Multidrug transporter n=1 Tax=Salinisphaera hydrothermalis (strain C41B8) TaxID=1304275 RepID=A0A084IIJ6_SALHC|nr:hypothetical protein [Salinisphaera hydrothermalis]KEZ76530.1 hypothetical protein C41B8_14425 [Salinisphaera hydrothermalis C41B8]